MTARADVRSNVVSIKPRELDISSKQPPILSQDEYNRDVRQLGAVVLEPYAPVVGARVEGFAFDATKPVAPELRNFLYRALLDYGFLSFAPGSVKEADFETFTQLFGKARFAGNPQAPRAAAGSESNAIDSHYKQTRTNYIWHIDQAYRPDPQKFTALFAVTVPGKGGDTVFSNTTAALSLLDPKFVAYLETLTVVHDADMQGLLSLAYQEPQALAEARAKNPPIEVPLLRAHPETGRKQIFANELYAQRILGVSRIVSDHLLGILFEQVKLSEVGATYAWEEGAVLIWDNRTVQHRGVYNYADQRRALHRAVID